MGDRAGDVSIEVRNNEAAHRFEAVVGTERAVLNYTRHQDELTLIHTEVPASLEGRGIGGALARTALDYARDHALRVVPKCPFVQSYIKRHPQYIPLVTRWPGPAASPGDGGTPPVEDER